MYTSFGSGPLNFVKSSIHILAQNLTMSNRVALPSTVGDFGGAV